MTARPSRPPIIAVAIIAGALGLGLVSAAAPTFWRVSTQDEFLRGDVDNLSVDIDGRLLLGPRAETVYEATDPFLWTLVAGRDALWLGSGNGGTVVRVELDGTAETVFESAELDVHALAVDTEGRVYAGTSPNGSVVALGDAGATEVFDPEEPYVWALSTAPDGALLVATGAPGRIYRVAPSGEAALLYDTEATHVRALAVDANGRILAGTGMPGRVFRIDPDGEAFVLLESDFDEISALHLSDDGTIHAVASSGAATPAAPATDASPPDSEPIASVAVSSQVTAVVAADAGGIVQTAPAAGPVLGTKGAVYRIAPDGVWDVVWSSSEDTPYDAVVDREGALVIGTGATGRIFRVTDTPRMTVLLTQAPTQQVTRFARGPDDRLYYTTANAGKLYRLSAGHAAEGSYLSDVRDARTIATWGAIRWRATTPAGSTIRLFTRSGNTATPGSTWSPWSDAYRDADGTAITSPKARYLQWRALLQGTEATPALLSVTTAYLPRNLRPEVTNLTVHPPGEVFQQPFSSGDPPIAGLDAERDDTRQASGSPAETQPATLGRRVYRKGLQTFVWTARDGNQDDLRFDVHYRSEDDPSWKVLTRNLTRTIFTWDTSSAPDGTYVVRVDATDAASNAPGGALRGSLSSQPFDVDNAQPVIVLEPARPSGTDMLVAFVVTDALSPIRHVEYSVDAEQWQVVYPMDGIPDSREERFEIVVAPEAAADVVVRAVDAMNNTSTAAVP